MKKIPSLFKRNYEGNRQVYDEVVPGSEWVLDGEGVPTEKYDGTSCMVADGVLFKRYDRKRNKKTGEYKDAPDGWISCVKEPDENTGHWPGWLRVGDGSEDKWHREAFSKAPKPDGTYELVGPKIQGNPMGFEVHILLRHGAGVMSPVEPLNFEGIKARLAEEHIEGIVWHHPDGRMVKIKAKDFKAHEGVCIECKECGKLGYIDPHYPPLDICNGCALKKGIRRPELVLIPTGEPKGDIRVRNGVTTITKSEEE